MSVAVQYPRLGLAVLTLLSACTLGTPSACRADEADAQPVRALLITGGCCHDYKFQSEKLIEGTRQHAHLEWNGGT